jgi:hypothetical protein|nr:MAG TPA: hypothetical protein [Caudoviricetes sp.]
MILTYKIKKNRTRKKSSESKKIIVVNIVIQNSKIVKGR